MVSPDHLDLLDERVIEVLTDWRDFLAGTVKRENPVMMDRWEFQVYEDHLDHREVAKEDRDHQGRKDREVFRELAGREVRTVIRETRDQEVPLVCKEVPDCPVFQARKVYQGRKEGKANLA